MFRRVTMGTIDPRPVRPVRGNPTRWHVSGVRQPWSQVVHTRGRLAVVRQNLVFGNQWQDVVPADRAGAVELTQVPLGAAVETSAQHGDLSFVSAGGRTGVLHLATDTVAVAP